MTFLTVGPTSTFLTIDAAMAVAFPGDTIQLEAGYSNADGTVSRNGITVDGGASSTGIHLQLASGVTDLILAGSAPISVQDTAASSSLIGNAGDNEITVTGGTDMVDGGLGIDRLVVDYHSATAAITGTSDIGFSAAGIGSVSTAGASVEHFTILAGSGINTLTTGAGDDRIETAGSGANTLAAGEGSNVITTGDGADTITIGGGNDTIFAGEGANTITGLGGDKMITVGAGADTITLTYGNNVIHAGAGANTITATSGSNIITAGAGADTVTVTSGNNRICVGDGANTVTATSGNNSITTGSGVDTIAVTGGNNIIHAGDGANTITATSGHNIIIGGSGVDTIAVTDGGNYIDVGDGANTVTAGAGNDTIITGADIDTVDAGAGDDVITAKGGVDGIAGGAGFDTLIVDVSGATGAVTISALAGTYSAGYAGNVSEAGTGVTTFAGIEAFSITTGSGNDQITTGGGDDTVESGTGNDMVNAGAGSDFVFGSVGDVIDGGEGGSDLDQLNLHGVGPHEIVLDPLNSENGTVYVLDAGGTRTGASLSFVNIEQIVDISFDVAPPVPVHVTVTENTESVLDMTSMTMINPECCDDLTVVLTASSGTITATSHAGVTVTFSGTGALTLAGSADDIDTYLNDLTKIRYTGDVGASGIDAATITVTAYDECGVVAIGAVHVDISPRAGQTVGTPGADTLLGGAGNDTLDGGAGNDQVSGGDGSDTVLGGKGNDNVFGGYGADVLFGGDGDDLVSASAPDIGAVFVEQPDPPSDNDLQGSDALFGGTGNDLLLGSFRDDTLDGGKGSDTMAGGAGNDTYVVDVETDKIIEYSGAGTDTVFSSITLTLIANVDNLTLTGNTAINANGNANGNILTGNSADNLLSGLGGADTMIGGMGNDSYVVESTLDRLVETANEGTDLVTSSVSWVLDADFENLSLSGSVSFNGTGNMLNNAINGNAGANRLFGMAGDDTLAGNAGADTLDGGAGNDSMDGGAGNDVYNVDSLGDTLGEHAAGGIDLVIASIDLTLGAELECLTLSGLGNLSGTGNALANRIIGNAGDNALFGLDGNDTLNGGAGDDTLDGGSSTDLMAGGFGNDTYVVETSTDFVSEALGAGTDSVRSSITLTLAVNVENLTLTGSDAINATGNGLANVLTGNAADNLLSGLFGADTMIGGLGNDSYVVDSRLDRLVENANQGTDKVTSAVTWTLIADFENLTLFGLDAIDGTGNGQSNLIVGNNAVNKLLGMAGDDVLTGNAGADILDGGAGNDTMDGGVGNDTYVVDTLGDKLIELGAHGTDLVITSINWTLGAEFENLTLGGISNLAGTANSAANRITGNIGDNVLSGLDGNDTLIGGAGNDTLDGGSGADSMTGGVGHDTYVVDTVFDRVAESAGAGTDTVLSSITLTLFSNVENLTLTGTNAITATGNGLNNLLIGNGADNLLTGLNGADTMIGGAGNDRYVVESALDRLVEYAGQGTDLVTSSVAWVLGNDFENLTLSGLVAIKGTGNALNNAISGNGGANILSGLEGDDKLTGNSGNDTLTGGVGADHFVFITASGNGIDTITDFSTLVGNPSQGDVLELVGLLHGTFAFRGIGAFSGGLDNSEARVVGKQVQIDINGDAMADILINLTGLSNTNQISAADFLWS